MEIATTKEYTQDELEEIAKEFKKYGFETTTSHTILKKAFGVPPDIMFILTFIVGMTAGEFVSGFFKKMGGDTWDLLKKGIKEVFKRKKEGMSPRILIIIPISKNGKITCLTEVESEKELDQALNSLPEFFEKNQLKIKDVDYFVPIYYEKESGWYLRTIPS